MFLLKVELDYILRKSKRLLIYSLHVQQSELQIKKVIKKWSQEGYMLYLWLIHVEIWQKTKVRKAIILQLKKNTQWSQSFFFLHITFGSLH